MRSALAAGVYLGTLETRRVVGDLGFSRNSYTPGSRLPEHAHGATYLCLALAGRFRERSGGAEQEVAPGMVVLHPRGERHADHFGPEPARCLSISIGRAWAGELEPLLRERARYAPEVALGTTARRLARELDEEDEASALALEGLTLELLAHFLRAERRPRALDAPWMPVVLERLRSEPSTTLGELATLTGLHPSTLVRAFRRAHACSPGEYRRRWRLERACRWLGEGELPLAEVAARAGFVDQSHLTRALRATLGVTPAAYRRAHGRR